MWAGVLNWFVNSRVGQWVGFAFGILTLLGGIYLRGLLKGRNDERVAQDKEALKQLRSRNKTNDEIDALSPAERRKRLSEWVSDDK
jgi:hypothetical protein